MPGRGTTLTPARVAGALLRAALPYVNRDGHDRAAEGLAARIEAWLSRHAPAAPERPGALDVRELDTGEAEALLLAYDAYVAYAGEAARGRGGAPMRLGEFYDTEFSLLLDERGGDAEALAEALRAGEVRFLCQGAPGGDG